jgi:hypothetical protein
MMRRPKPRVMSTDTTEVYLRAVSSRAHASGTTHRKAKLVHS